MGGQRGVPEPYIILEEFVCDAIYESSEEGGDVKGESPEHSPPPPTNRDDGEADPK